MKFGLMLPNKDRQYSDPGLLVKLALSAEQAGWEGFFLWNHIGGATIRPPWTPGSTWRPSPARPIHALGDYDHPPSLRRPWKVARKLVTLGVGRGDLVDKNFKSFGEASGPRTRSTI
jgi:hypothetical protein